MDPTEAFNEMMENFACGMHVEATEHATNLANWLNRGGVPPTLRISANERMTFEFTDQLASQFCRAACKLVLEHPETPFDPIP